MLNASFLLLIAAWMVLLTPVESAAQRVLRTRFEGVVLSVWGGGAAFTDLQRAQLNGGAKENATAAISTRSGSQVQRLMADASPSVGVSVAYWPKPSLGVRIQTGVAFTRYNLLIPPAAAELQTDSGGPSLKIWSHDVSLLVRAPVTPGNRVMPYGIVGGGVLHYQGGVRPSVEPFRPVRSALRPAVVLGIGATVPLEQGGTGLTFEILDHIARTPIAAPHGSEPADGHVRWANHLRLTVGISILGL